MGLRDVRPAFSAKTYQAPDPYQRTPPSRNLPLADVPWRGGRMALSEKQLLGLGRRAAERIMGASAVREVVVTMGGSLRKGT
jgi:hypothetical protein